MITDSYSAACYIEMKDGKYNMDCSMIMDDKDVFTTTYKGEDFAGGLNGMIEDLMNQMLKKPEEPEPKPETPEEEIARLKKLVEQLENENAALNNRINEEQIKKCCSHPCNKKTVRTVDDWKSFEDILRLFR